MELGKQSYCFTQNTELVLATAVEDRWFCSAKKVPMTDTATGETELMTITAKSA